MLERVRKDEQGLCHVSLSRPLGSGYGLIAAKSISVVWHKDSHKSTVVTYTRFKHASIELVIIIIGWWEELQIANADEFVLACQHDMCYDRQGTRTTTQPLKSLDVDVENFHYHPYAQAPSFLPDSGGCGLDVSVQQPSSEAKVIS